MSRHRRESSGSGKTVTSKAVLGLIATPPGDVKKTSEIIFDGQNIMNYSEKEWRAYRGKDAAMIFQDPMTSLNPTMKVGKQIMESILLHSKVSKDEAKKRALELLKMVNIPNPEERMNQYPYEFSGGMRQRVVIAIALACNPKADDRRRAHHGSGRDHSGTDHRSAEKDSERKQYGRCHDHP